MTGKPNQSGTTSQVHYAGCRQNLNYHVHAFQGIGVFSVFPQKFGTYVTVIVQKIAIPIMFQCHLGTFCSMRIHRKNNCLEVLVGFGMSHPPLPPFLGPLQPLYKEQFTGMLASCPCVVRKMSDTVTVQNVRRYCQTVANFTGVQFLLTWLHYCIISRPSGGKMSSSDPLEDRRARVVRKATSVNFRFGGKQGRAAPRKKI